jgi:hypothetical protein
MGALQYRITDDVLLSINTTDSARIDFLKYAQGPQWLEAGTIDKVVWNAGPYQAKLNKVATSTELIPVGDLATDNQRIMSGSLLVRQGFSWNNVFGIMLVVKGMETGNVLISRLWQISDMAITEDTDVQLVDGAMFVYSVPFNLPNMGNESLMASAIYVTYDDILADGPDIGLVTNYPNDVSAFEPLNSSAPLPDYITAAISFDNNQYVVVTPQTLETNKTLQQSILDYFGFTNNVVPVGIEYTLRYGNDAVGYSTLRLSNEDNNFEPVKVGLDFTPWLGSGLVTILVVMEVTANNVMLSRQQNRIFDLQDNVAPFLNAVISNQEITVYPVTVTKQTTVNNTVIDTNQSVKIVPILQPVYVEMQSQDITYENKKVSFPNVKTPSIMNVAASDISPLQYIVGQQTEDNKYYFDLGTITQPENGTAYTVTDSTTKGIITRGTIVNP